MLDSVIKTYRVSFASKEVVVLNRSVPSPFTKVLQKLAHCFTFTKNTTNSCVVQQGDTLATNKN